MLLANDTIAKINSGENFDDLAKTLSEDPGLATNPKGYTITNNGKMVAEFESAAFSLQIGEVSVPVQTSYGYHVLKREPLLPIEEFRITGNYSSIAAELVAEKENELTEQWRNFAKIEKNENAYKCSFYIENLKENNDNILWDISAQTPINVWFGVDNKDNLPKILEIKIDSTPLGAVQVTPSNSKN